jgi:hypothetical protein
MELEEYMYVKDGRRRYGDSPTFWKIWAKNLAVNILWTVSTTMALTVQKIADGLLLKNRQIIVGLARLTHT